jgi:hypothetical protein
MGVIKKTSLMIGSMQALIEEIKELIVIKNQAKSTMQKVEQSAAVNKNGAGSSKPESKYFNSDQDNAL